MFLATVVQLLARLGVTQRHLGATAERAYPSGGLFPAVLNCAAAAAVLGAFGVAQPRDAAQNGGQRQKQKRRRSGDSLVVAALDYAQGYFVGTHHPTTRSSGPSPPT